MLVGGRLRRDVDRLTGVVERIVAVQERGLPVLAALKRRVEGGEEPPPPGAEHPRLRLVGGGRHARPERHVGRLAAAGVVAGLVMVGTSWLAPDGAPLRPAGASPTSQPPGRTGTAGRRGSAGGGQAPVGVKWGRQPVASQTAGPTTTGGPAAVAARPAGTAATWAPSTAASAVPTSTTLGLTTTTLEVTTTLCLPVVAHHCQPDD